MKNAWIGDSYINSGSTHLGAIVVFIASFFWSGRRHFKTVFLKAIGRAGVDDPEEATSYTVGFWGFRLSVVGVAAWCWMVEICSGLARWSLGYTA